MRSWHFQALPLGESLTRFRQSRNLGLPAENNGPGFTFSFDTTGDAGHGFASSLVFAYSGLLAVFFWVKFHSGSCHQAKARLPHRLIIHTLGYSITESID
jgi:hypothetical protein